ncbi:hypothetical protein NDU88_002936 [Pleurodeles waltl]|uniref:Uncharacterized protein n=1 Tax=Pleurodeles waltl TaxID=8319 RepID=A0AAV7SG02_PLEWA|nr:hypothetical protein NDU88_002936 [Pleurodeles waltl]
MDPGTPPSSEAHATMQLALQKMELTLQSHTSQFEKILQAILDTKTTLEAKIGSRWTSSNICLVGFPERVEGPSTELFIEQWLTDTILKDNIPKFFSVERAHRVPGRPPPPGSQPRLLIARLLNYRDRDLILQLFRKSGPLRFENAEITAYPDFTAEVQKKRSSFYHVKECLRKHNIKYALMFPARLRIQDDTRALFFTTPEDAWTWLHAKGLADPIDTSTLGENWSSPKTRRRQRKKQGIKPSPEQSQTERSLLLQATSRFVNTSPTALSTQTDGEPYHDVNSDSVESTRGPTLTPRTADDIC